MSVKRIFTRAAKAAGSGRNHDTEAFIRSNPDCPRQLAEFIQATRQNFQLMYERLEADVSGLKEGQARLEERQTVMSGQLSNLIVTVDRNEVGRAGRRAEVLGRAAGAPARAVVIGESASQEDLDLAVRENVAFLQVAGRRPNPAENALSPETEAGDQAPAGRGPRRVGRIPG